MRQRQSPQSPLASKHNLYGNRDGNWKNGNNKFIHIFDNVIYLLSINKNRINQGAKKIVELHYEISQRLIVEQFAGKLNFGPEHLVGDSK